MDDLDGVTGNEVDPNAQAGGVDAEYGSWDDTVPEAKVSGQTIQPFGFYVAQPFKAILREIKAGTTPSGRVGVKIVEGPLSAMDARVFDDLYLGVSTEKQSEEIGPNGRPIKVPKTAAEIAKSTNYFQHSLNRLAQALGLALKHPASRAEGALEIYLGQFDGENLPLFVVEIGIETRPGQQPRNRIKWDTARHPNEPAVDKALAAKGVTALDEARLRIGERNVIEEAKAKISMKKAGLQTLTANTSASANGNGSVAMPSPTLD